MIAKYITISAMAGMLTFANSSRILENSTKSAMIETAVTMSKVHTPNNRQVIAINWKLKADKHRFFIIDVKTKKITYSWYTSHGSGSGAVARATKFSDRRGSHMSSLGLMKTAETYYSNKFKAISLRLDGLQRGINGNVRARAIVMHPAGYVSKFYIKRVGYAGRSQGCITLDPAVSDKIINQVKGGTLIVNIYD